MRHTEQEGAGGREEEIMFAVELATRAYRKSEMMRSGLYIDYNKAAKQKVLFSFKFKEIVPQ